MKNLKQRIKANEAVHGCWLNMGSSVSAEIVGRTGFDWLLIDLEHGAGNDTIMLAQLQALASGASTPIVRADEAGRSKIQRILDYGASGIMFPQIQNAQEAKTALSMMYYPPHGTRGMAKMVRATNFGASVDEYAGGLGMNIVGIVQIETLGALSHLDGIAALPDADVLFVGPSDLSLAMGMFNQFDHADFQKAIKDVALAAKKHGKAAGILLQNISEYKMYYDLGYRFIACGADSSFVMSGAKEMLKKMRTGIL
jgi:4-hydroxy-2-oxoheptanedioate aldolase